MFEMQEAHVTLTSKYFQVTEVKGQHCDLQQKHPKALCLDNFLCQLKHMDSFEEFYLIR